MSSTKFQVVVTDFIHEPLEIEREILGDVADVHALSALSSEEIDERVDQADALLVYHFVSIQQSVIERLVRCRVIVRCGAGFDNVDHAFARTRGIDVCNVPDYGTEDVADTALGLMLSLTRGTHLLNAHCHRGTHNWSYELARPLWRLRGRTFGVLGIGRIGTAAALRAKAFGMDVAYYDPYARDGTDKALGIRRVERLQDLLAQSHVLSCHCCLSEETRHIINCDSLQAMRPGSFLINTARGAVVEPEAILTGLESGRLAGAGIDVLAEEPPSDEHPLLKAWREPSHPAYERLILTPHAAFYCEEGLEDMRRKGCENVRRVLLGEPARNVIN